MAALMDRNRALCSAATDLLTERTGLRPAAPPTMRAAMSSLLVDVVPEGLPASTAPTVPALQDALRLRYAIEVPVIPAADGSGRYLVRISAHAHNKLSDYEALADALNALL